MPAELRELILEYAVVADLPLLLQGPCAHHDWQTAVQPAITRVDRQTRDEALPVFYGKNVFEAHISRLDFGCFINHMQLIGPRNVQLMRHIMLSNTADTQFERASCAEVAFEFVRWYATTQGSEGLHLLHGPHRRNERLIMELVSLAMKSRAGGETSELRLRGVFEGWLSDENMECECEVGNNWDWDTVACSNKRSCSTAQVDCDLCRQSDQAPSIRFY